MRWWLPSLLVLAASSWPAHARSLGSIDFETCTLAPVFTPASVDARCARLDVPADHDRPDGTTIELALAWIPARDGAEDDPVFMLAGGPGQSARDSYPGIAAAFADVRRHRNILLLDQRGTGASTPLVCEEQPEVELAAGAGYDPDEMRRAAEACRDRLGAQLDLRHFTTSETVRDLEWVRARIGAEQVNLVGISYGTRVAQHYARRFPEHTRSLVLDGVVPNTLVLGAEHSANLDAALALHFEYCRSLPECRGQLGDPGAGLDALLEQVDRDELVHVYPDPVTARPREERLTRDHVIGVVRLYAYSPLTAALLPLSLHEALQGRAGPLLAQARLLTDSMSLQIHHGMQLSVLCSEDADELAGLAPETGLLGTALADLTRAQCAVWPRGTRPADFREPLRGQVPTLLLSGELDPVTPPRYGDEVLAGLGRARHLVLRGQGHNVLGTGCTPKLVARFISTADPLELDAACLDGLRAPPPFVDFSGWEP